MISAGDGVYLGGPSGGVTVSMPPQPSADRIASIQSEMLMGKMGNMMATSAIVGAAASVINGITTGLSQYYQAEAQKYTFKIQGEIDDRQAGMAVHNLNSKLDAANASISTTKKIAQPAALERVKAEADLQTVKAKLSGQRETDKAYRVDSRGLDITFSRMDHNYGSPVRGI